MKDLLVAGLLIQIFAPFLVTCIFTLLGFFFGRWWGRRQGYRDGWLTAMQKRHQYDENGADSDE